MHADTRRLVVATLNQGKLREMSELLADAGWQVEGLPADAPDFAESGETFAENARAKALYRSRQVHVPVLADDSGLVIDALDGEPGVRSARYIDPALSPAQRNRAVLEMLTGIEPADRTARFVCHLVLASRGEVVHETEGTCEGRIADAPRGDGGFGYDPIFLDPELGKTFGELAPQEKDARSHRGAAMRAMARFLRTWRPDS